MAEPTPSPVEGCTRQPGPPPWKDEISIVVANYQGVTGKMASLKNMLTSLEPDIFLAVESKLDNSVYVNDFLPAGYSTSHKDRKRGGGRVFIATKEPIKAAPLPELDTECELSWVKIHLEAAKTLIIGVFYRPPDSPTKCLQELEWSFFLVRQRYPEAIPLLGGDFNLAGNNWNSLLHVPRSPRRRTANSCSRSLHTSTWTS